MLAALGWFFLLHKDEVGKRFSAKCKYTTNLICVVLAFPFFFTFFLFPGHNVFCSDLKKEKRENLITVKLCFPACT